MNLQRVKLIGFLSLSLLVISGKTYAQDERAMARAQQMLRQLSAEKAQLQQEVTQLREEYANYRSETEKALAAAEAKQKKLSESAAGLARDGKQLDHELNGVRQSLQEEQVKVAKLQQNLQVQTENLNTCKQSNEALADTAYDLIGLYQEKGFVDVLSKREPVTGIAKIKVENIVQTFEDKVMENRLENNPQALQPVDEGSPDREVAGESGED